VAWVFSFKFWETERVAEKRGEALHATGLFPV
jgi:hypothetical protein